MNLHFLERLGITANDAPQAPAILLNGVVVLTFDQLLSNVERVGRQLQAAGAGSEHVVALSIEKSPEWVVGMLATWWCGAAWMPLEPSLPVNRRKQLLDQSGAQFILLTESSNDPHLLGMPAIRIHVDPKPIEDDRKATPRGAKEVSMGPGPWRHQPNSSLAYVIPTSGSSGTPKLVAITHRGLVPMLTIQIEALGLRPKKRVLWALSTSFDASVSDVGTALLSGAAICIERDPLFSSPKAIFEVLRLRQVTHADLAPAVLNCLDPRQAPDNLETVIFGGEPCNGAAVRSWAQKVRLLVSYGPTEATVCTSIGHCNQDQWRDPLLGKPLAGVRYVVLDENGKECPPDVPGELHIGGNQLARGYLNSPELTAARFVTRDGDRLYRTGDRVTHRPDGEFQFLGRIDREIKLRGKRLAPEEVETQLGHHASVARAAVLKRKVGKEDALVAFIESKSSSGCSVSDLKKHLLQRLPPWMVPAHYQHLGALPSTPNGKIDFSRLEQRALNLKSSSTDKPRTFVEKQIAHLYEEILGIRNIGIYDDFFKLGGDSIATLQLATAAFHRGLHLSPELVTKHPAVEQLAAEVEAQTKPETRSAKDLWTDVAQGCAWLRSNSIPDKKQVSCGHTARLGTQILLTGGTGFLGSLLLKNILSANRARVTCLIRGSDSEEARSRLYSAIGQHGNFDEEEAGDRLNIVLGDLSRPQLGLDASKWSQLTQKIDTVFHAGAVVNLSQPYELLCATNVYGTRSVLALVGTGRPKALHYISTLSVFVSTERNTGIALEKDDLSSTQSVYGGYAQSKWVAEAMVRCAPITSPINIYRLGLVTGDRRLGYVSDRDWLAYVVRAIARARCIPIESNLDLAFDVTPVDYAATALLHLAARAQENKRVLTFHVAGSQPATLSRLIDAMRSAGVPVSREPLQTFRRRLEGSGALIDRVAGFGLTQNAAPTESNHFYRPIDLFQATHVRFDDAATRKALAGIPLCAPTPSHELLSMYVRNILAGRTSRYENAT